MPRAGLWRHVRSMKQRYRSGCRPCEMRDTARAIRGTLPVTRRRSCRRRRVPACRAARVSRLASRLHRPGVGLTASCHHGSPSASSASTSVPRPHPRRVSDLQIEAAAREHRGEVELPVEEALLRRATRSHTTSHGCSRAPPIIGARRRSSSSMLLGVAQLVPADSWRRASRAAGTSRLPSGLRPRSCLQRAIHCVERRRLDPSRRPWWPVSERPEPQRASTRP